MLGAKVSCFAAYCRSQRTALRHGAVDLEATTKAQLKPYLKLVRSRIAKSPNSQAWVTLDRRWVGQGIAKAEQAERDRKARKPKERQELHVALSKLV